MANLTQQIHQMVLYDLYALNPPVVPKSVFAFHNIYTKNVEAPLGKWIRMKSSHTLWPPACSQTFILPSYFLPTTSEKLSVISGFLGLGLAREMHHTKTATRQHRGPSPRDRHEGGEKFNAAKLLTQSLVV